MYRAQQNYFRLFPMIEVYAVKIEKDRIITEFDKIFPLLAPEKKDEITKISPLIKDIYTLLGEAIIRQSISKKINCHTSQIKILTDSFGKPYCKHPESCYFNISHSGEWVVCALENEPVGIDIQKIVKVPRKRMDMIVLRFFHKYEQTRYFNLSVEERENFFFSQWALKESYIKLLGKGLRIPLHSFFAFLDQTGKGSMPDGKHIRYFQQYDIDRNYKMVVCSSSNSFPLSLKKITIPSLAYT